MSDQSKKSRGSWLPDWVRTRLHRRKLRRTIRELKNHYEPLIGDGNGDYEQAALSKFLFEVQEPKSELAEYETIRLRKRAHRWNVDPPSSELDSRTRRWYIPETYSGSSCGATSEMLDVKASNGGVRSSWCR